MNRTVIAAAAAAVGVALAVLSFQSPDTGGDVPEVAARPTSNVPPPTVSTVPPPEVGADGLVSQGDRKISPGNAALEARRAQPDAMAASDHAVKWNALRMELARAGADKQLAIDISELVRDLREARMRPDAADFAALASREQALLARLDEVDLGDDVARLVAELRGS